MKILITTQIFCVVLGVFNALYPLKTDVSDFLASQSPAHHGCQKKDGAGFSTGHSQTFIFKRALSKQSSNHQSPDTLPKFDEYGDIPLSAEKQRLDYFAKELHSVPGEHGHIIEYRSKRQKRRPLTRAKRAKEYLIEVKGIEPARIRLVNGGYQKEFKIELRLGPLNSP